MARLADRSGYDAVWVGDSVVAKPRLEPLTTLAYLAGVTEDGLDRVVDTRWDPPVTAGVRLVSILGDLLQHLGQAAYVRGLPADS